MQAAYGQFQRPGYPGNYPQQAQFAQPQQQAYNYPPEVYQYPGNVMYNGQGQFPQGYPMSRGRGVGYPSNRGGFSRGTGFRGRGRGGFVKRKKPFVGGSLETQREWERQTACCFFQQGNCKFGDNCRFLHEEIQEGVRPCQFGDTCRVHGSQREENNNENGSQENEGNTSA